MQAPALNPTASGAAEGQYHVMTSGSTGQSGGCAAGVCGQQAGGIESEATVVGTDPAAAAASLFAPGSLDREDAILLWTGVNSLLFITLVYLEVRR